LGSFNALLVNLAKSDRLLGTGKGLQDIFMMLGSLKSYLIVIQGFTRCIP